MALLRLIHAADMPDPASLLQRLSGEGTVAAPASAPASKASGPSAKLPADFPALINRLEEGGRHQLAVQLHDQVSLVRYAPPELMLKPTAAARRRLAARARCRSEIADRRPLAGCAVGRAGEPSLLDQEKMAEERVRADVLADPNVRAVMDAFPDAELDPFPREAPDMPEMPDLNAILKLAQNAQAELQKAQDNLDTIEVEGAAGGGLVKIRATAKGRILGVEVDESLLAAGREVDGRGPDRRRHQRRPRQGRHGRCGGNAEDDQHNPAAAWIQAALLSRLPTARFPS